MENNSIDCLALPLDYLYFLCLTNSVIVVTALNEGFPTKILACAMENTFSHTDNNCL